MNKKSFLLVLMVFAMSVFFLAGCSKTNEDEQNEAIREAVEEALEEQETKEEAKEEAKAEQEAATKASDEFTFADLSYWEFWFSSGVGAWSTGLSVAEDGSFSGSYQDTDMGDMGDGYPNGTVYYSEFTGQFTQPVKLNDYTYSVEIESIEYVYGVDTEEIIDGARYVYTEANGIVDTDYLYFYLPGAPLDELPQEYREWAGYYDLSQIDETELPFYGLYNVNMQSGFVSYDSSEDVSDEIYMADTPTIDERIASVEFSEEQENEIFDRGDATQSELNAAEAAIYQMWDDELNWIWAEMETRLDTHTMDQLRIEQREWIAKKEKAMKKAGAEAEGGTMQPMLELAEGAKMTKERVYELAKWLR